MHTSGNAGAGILMALPFLFGGGSASLDLLALYSPSSSVKINAR